MFTCHTPFFLSLFFLALLLPLPPTNLCGCPPPPTLDSCPPDPLAGATPPIGRLSRCVHLLSLTTTSRARRASWRTPSRALHALHPLIRGTARTGTPLPSPSMPLYTAPLLLLCSCPPTQGPTCSRTSSGFSLSALFPNVELRNF